MHLTTNFTLEELTKSETALRLGLDNYPTQEEINNLQTLCTYVLQPVRDYFNTGVKVNSGFRSVEVNAAVGGVSTSDHCRGMAADIEIPGLPNAELARWIQNNLYFKQCILEFYTLGVPESGWVHVSFDPNNLKQECLTATKQNGRTVYLPGIVD